MTTTTATAGTVHLYGELVTPETLQRHEAMAEEAQAQVGTRGGSGWVREGGGEGGRQAGTRGREESRYYREGGRYQREGGRGVGRYRVTN